MMFRHPAAGVARQLRTGLQPHIVAGARRFDIARLSTMSPARVASTPRYLQRFPHFGIRRPCHARRFYHAQFEPAPSRWPRFAGLFLFIAGGGVAAYWLAAHFLTSARALALTEKEDEVFKLWLSLMKDLPPGCADEFNRAFVYAADPTMLYPTKAVHHFILGLELLGDVHDASWEKVCKNITHIVVSGLAQNAGWDAVCDLVDRMCSHLEKRAAAKLDGVGKAGSIDDDALRENRRLFLQDAVLIPYNVCGGFEAHKQRRALQASPGMAVLPASEVPTPDLAYPPRLTALLDRAVDIMLRELPPSTEYASHPEKLDFLNCSQRASILCGTFVVHADSSTLCSPGVFNLDSIDADISRATVQAGFRQDCGDAIGAAFYLMQCVYQIPETSEIEKVELASAALMIASAFNDAMQQKIEQQGPDQFYLQNGAKIPPDEHPFHSSLDLLRSLSGPQLAAMLHYWATTSIAAIQESQSSSPSSAAQPKVGPVSQETEAAITFPETGRLDLHRVYLKSVYLRALGRWMFGDLVKARRELLDAMELAEARGWEYTEMEKGGLISMIRSLEEDIKARGLKEEDEQKVVVAGPADVESS